jgi:hypothetical protein
VKTVSGETEDRSSAWTIDTLKAHYDQRFIDQERAVAAALAAADRAALKAETASEKRFDAVNEFRGQLADQASTFMPRQEAQVSIGSLADKLDLQAARLDKLEGRSSGFGSIGALVAGGVAILGTIIIVANLLTS